MTLTITTLSSAPVFYNLLLMNKSPRWCFCHKSCCSIVVEIDVTSVPPSPVVPAAAIPVVVSWANPEVIEPVIDSADIGVGSSTTVGIGAGNPDSWSSCARCC
jgi:hypothetical protein